MSGFSWSLFLTAKNAGLLAHFLTAMLMFTVWLLPGHGIVLCSNNQNKSESRLIPVLHLQPQQCKIPCLLAGAEDFSPNLFKQRTVAAVHPSADPSGPISVLKLTAGFPMFCAVPQIPPAYTCPWSKSLESQNAGRETNSCRISDVPHPICPGDIFQILRRNSGFTSVVRSIYQPRIASRPAPDEYPRVDLNTCQPP